MQKQIKFKFCEKTTQLQQKRTKCQQGASWICGRRPLTIVGCLSSCVVNKVNESNTKVKQKCAKNDHLRLDIDLHIKMLNYTAEIITLTVWNKNSIGLYSWCLCSWQLYGGEFSYNSLGQNLWRLLWAWLDVVPAGGNVQNIQYRIRICTKVIHETYKKIFSLRVLRSQRLCDVRPVQPRLLPGGDGWYERHD